MPLFNDGSARCGDAGSFGLTSSGQMPVDVKVDLGEDSVEKSPRQWAQAWVRANGVKGAQGPPNAVLPFGLLCFGMTCCMLSFSLTGWAEPAFFPMVISNAIIFGGVGELIAGLLEIIKGNVLSGTVLSCFGCFWLSWGLCQYWILVLGVPALTNGTATGLTLYLILWGVLASGFFVVTLATNYCLQWVLGWVALIFLVLAGGQYSAHAAIASGYIAFLAGIGGIYTALAMIFKAELAWMCWGLGGKAWPIAF